jgi:subtilisin family serine protease
VRAPLAALASVLLATWLAAPALARVGDDRWLVVLERDVRDPGAVARTHDRRHDAAVGPVFREALRGYAATIPSGEVDDVRDDPRVAYVERDRRVAATAQVLPWGVDAVDADLGTARAGDGTGVVAGVTTYVVDTGLDATHPDLPVAGAVSFADGPVGDCAGHGTKVAGTLAARDDAEGLVGTAPGAPLVDVRVLGCDGLGYVSTIVAGLDWITAQAARPAVVNLSLDGPPSQALDDAVLRSARSGVFYALAAGNDGADACDVSPARLGGAGDDGIVTVAATDRAGREPAWSNAGRCVDLWAPGSRIPTTAVGGGTTRLSGTSIATPHVAGGAATVLAERPDATAAAVEEALRGAAVPTGAVSRDGRPVLRLALAGF